MQLNRVYLNVTYAERDEAKELGARWDPSIKRWWIDKKHTSKVKKWLPLDILEEAFKTLSVSVPVDLNKLMLQTSTGPRPRIDHGVQGRDTRVIFKHLDVSLCKEINNADFVMGCVAWLAHPDILEALSKKVCSLIVQKEEYLRETNNPWSRNLSEQYSKLHGPVFMRDIPGVSKDDLSVYPVGAIRCIGNSLETSSRMHNKFIVLCKAKDGLFTPYAVWTGSFNFTKSATLSLENAVLLTESCIVDAYAKEFVQNLALSESIKWKESKCTPEFMDWITKE